MIVYMHIQIHTYTSAFFFTGSDYALKFGSQAVESAIIYYIYDLKKN